MNSKYELPNNFKYMFFINFIIAVVGMVANNHVAVASATIIFVILSVSVEILEKIHEAACKE